MDRKALTEFLAGKRQLTEMGFNSPGAGAAAGLPPMWTGRQERLSQAWTDIMVRLEAIALDVLDVSEDLYFECLPLLKDIRGASSEMVHDQLPRFQGILSLLVKYQGLHADMQIHIQHMQQLCQELQYVCDEITPRDPKVPEAPPRRKEDWATGALGAKKPDVTFSHPGGEAQWESTLKQHIKGKGGNEARENPGPHPSCPSLVMASLGSAADSIAESIGDLEANFLRAGDAVRLTLEAYTDVDRADVEVSGVSPGSFPRLEVTCRFKGSDTVGRCSLYWAENGKERALCVEGIKDDTLLMSENLTDAQVASRVYSCLDAALDFRPCAARLGVVPTLYRMLERAGKGTPIQPEHVEQVLAGLSARLGLHESVQLTPDRVKLHCEAISPIIWSWFYDWEHEEVGADSPRDLVKTPDGPTYEDPAAGLTERSLLGAFKSPSVRVNLEAKTVSIVGPDDEEEVCQRSMTDEDVTARLLSMSYQKEDVMRGHVVESEWERAFLEQEGFDAKDHPRNLQTGEFVDAGSANSGQRKAAYAASRADKRRAAKSKREKGKVIPPATPKGTMPPDVTEPEKKEPSWQPTDAEKHPLVTKPEEKPGPADPGQAPKKADTTPPESPKAEEPKTTEVPAQEPQQPHGGQTTTMDPLGNIVTQTPPVPDKITQPQPILDPMGNVVGYAPVAPVLPPPAVMQQPSQPKKGKELPMDEPFAQPKKGSEAPTLPDAPKSTKDMKKIAISRDKVGVATHPEPEEPSDEEKKKQKPQPVIPQPPKGGGVKRHNPDLDAAFGFGPPAGEQPQQPVPPTSAEPKPEQPTFSRKENPELDAVMGVPEAQAVQQVQQDPELQAAAKDLGTEEESAEDVKKFEELAALFSQASPPQQPQQPGQGADTDDVGVPKQHAKEMATIAGKLASKMYAKDLLKAREMLKNDPKFQALKPEQRTAAIQGKAQELQGKRVEFWNKVGTGAGKVWDNIKTQAKWTFDSILDLSDIEAEQGAKSYEV